MRIAQVLLKVLAWIGAAIVALVIAVYLYVLGVNWHDRPPSKAALRLEETFHNRPSVHDEDNAYIYLVGFSVEKTKDPREWGMKRIAWAQQLAGRLEHHGSDDQPGSNLDIRNTRSPAVQALSDTCRTVDRACLSALEGGEETIAEWLSAESWLLLLNRYRTLLSHPG